MLSALGPSKAAWAVGDKPLWEYPAVRQLILARSLEGGPAPAPPYPPLSLAGLTESLQLVSASLRALFESEAAVSLKPCVGRVYSAFERAIELSRVFSGVKDHAGFFELLTTPVSQVKALTPGSSIVIPGGFRGGLLLYVLHADSFEECTLAVCASGDGLEYHPCARGVVRTNAPPNPV